VAQAKVVRTPRGWNKQCPKDQFKDYRHLRTYFIRDGKIVEEFNLFGPFISDDDDSQDEWLCAATVQQPERMT
jgi:hypothetical protein